MKLHNLELAVKLKSELTNAAAWHRAISNQLQPQKRGEYSWTKQVRISVGGDSYGNGKIKDVTMEVCDSIDAKKILMKEESKAWGIVVGLRADLRMLGVDIDEHRVSHK